MAQLIIITRYRWSLREYYERKRLLKIHALATKKRMTFAKSTSRVRRTKTGMKPRRRYHSNVGSRVIGRSRILTRSRALQRLSNTRTGSRLTINEGDTEDYHKASRENRNWSGSRVRVASNDRTRSSEAGVRTRSLEAFSVRIPTTRSLSGRAT